MATKIKVMIVDDSAVVRQVNRETLEREPDIEVIGTAIDPIYAMEKMKLQWPDVLVIDIEMPRMDGLTFLKKIMAEHPTPTIVCSSLAEKGASATMDALAAGALAIITKPKGGVKQFLQDSSNDLVSAVRAAAKANMRRVTPGAARPLTPSPKLSADVMMARAPAASASMVALAPFSAREEQTIVGVGCSLMIFLRKVRPSMRGISMSITSTSGHCTFILSSA